jgi:hypothetical protein
MRAFDYFTSWAALASLFLLGPALGGQLFPRAKSPIARAACTLIGISVLLALYGVVWHARPQSVEWYSWLGGIPVDIPQPLDVNTQ